MYKVAMHGNLSNMFAQFTPLKLLILNWSCRFESDKRDASQSSMSRALQIHLDFNKVCYADSP